MSNVNIEFCRTLLSMAMRDVKPVTTVEQRKDAWVYKVMDDHWEFHGPDNFYWHGSADNAYDARAKGWHAWLEKFHHEKASPDNQSSGAQEMNPVKEIYKDSDGWWAVLKPGFQIDGAHGWREDTKKKLLQSAKDAQKCECPDCSQKRTKLSGNQTPRQKAARKRYAELHLQRSQALRAAWAAKRANEWKRATDLFSHAATLQREADKLCLVIWPNHRPLNL